MDRSLSGLLAAVEKRKSQTLREKLGIPSSLQLDSFQLESLAYHLTERSGPVFIQLVPNKNILKVSEPGSCTCISYRTEAIAIVLKAWGLTREEAQKGQTIEVTLGKRTK